MSTKINQTQIQALKSWATQVKSIVAKKDILENKIANLQTELDMYNNQIKAYDGLIPTVFGTAFPESTSVTDLIRFEKEEGATLVKFNPQYIKTEDIQSVDRNGRVSHRYSYYIAENESELSANTPFSL